MFIVIEMLLMRQFDDCAMCNVHEPYNVSEADSGYGSQ